VKSSEGWRSEPGGDRYLFYDGRISDEARETWPRSGTSPDFTGPGPGEASAAFPNISVVARFTGQGDSNYDSMVSTFNASTGATTTVIDRGRSGYLPPISYLPGFGPPYGDEDGPDARQAAPGATQTLLVNLKADGLAQCHVARHVKASFPMAESEDELLAAAIRLVQAGARHVFTGEIFANFNVTEGDSCRITYTPFGIIDEWGIIDTITHQGGGPDVPVTTSIVVSLYPELGAVT